MAAPDKSFPGPDGWERCWWCAGDEAFVPYHDEEWGFPVDDDRRLFEKICLEGFQAGLSWRTILNKRENFRKGFSNFEIAKVAKFGPKQVERLLGDAGIVRHRGKIESTITKKCVHCARGPSKRERPSGGLFKAFHEAGRPRRSQR